MTSHPAVLHIGNRASDRLFSDTGDLVIDIDEDGHNLGHTGIDVKVEGGVYDGDGVYTTAKEETKVKMHWSIDPCRSFLLWIVGLCALMLVKQEAPDIAVESLRLLLLNLTIVILIILILFIMLTILMIYQCMHHHHMVITSLIIWIHYLLLNLLALNSQLCH